MRAAAIVLLGVACTSDPGDPTHPATPPDPDTDGDPTESDTDTDADSDTDDPTEPAAEGLCQVALDCGGGILDSPKTPCTMQVLDAGGATVYDGSVGVELRGRSSLYFPKKQYSVELRAHSELPVWPDSTWSYLADGTDAGVAWREPGFDDSAWSSGPAALGSGGLYLQTEVTLVTGSLTTYFRRDFTVGSVADITNLDLGLSVHDGAVVYLNGVEILRQNLPDPASWDTPARGDIPADDYSWVTAEVDPSLLVEGTNVVAVEAHRVRGPSADLRFNLWLEASGDDLPTNLLGMGKEEDWILNGQYVDRSLFRNRLAFDLFQSLGDNRYATDLRFCELALNGEYMGVYTLGEKLERDDDRIPIAEGDPPGSSFIVKLGDSGGFHDNAIGYGQWELVYPDPGPRAEALVNEWLTGWEEATLGPEPESPDTGIFAWVDLASAVDWVLVQELMKNNDAYQLSVWLWKDETGKMFFAPWDLDLSMGYPYLDCSAEGFVSREAHDRDGESVSLMFVERMADVPAFHDALVARWEELRASEWTEEAIVARIAGYDAILAPAIEPNFARWPIEDIVFQTDDPTVENWLCPVSSYADEHERTLGFLHDRLLWLDDNIGRF